MAKNPIPGDTINYYLGKDNEERQTGVTSSGMVRHLPGSTLRLVRLDAHALDLFAHGPCCAGWR